jgi:trehalose/maltose transport system substrate-binding protein
MIDRIAHWWCRRPGMSRRTRRHPAAVAAVLIALALGGAADEAAAAKIVFACGGVGLDYQLCREGAQAWAAEKGQQVEVLQSPAAADARLALFQQMLAAGSSDVDVFQVDVVWPGTLGGYFIDLRPYFDDATIKRNFPAAVENDTVGGKLKAMPWYADVGLLYYRKDLLDKYGIAVPRSWADLAAAARKVLDAEHAAGNGALVGYVFQGKAYEGLTCNGLEWIRSFGGGEILDKNGKVTLDNPEAARALGTVAGWIGSVAPEGVLNYAEDDARGVFQAGHAVFMRNWPYAWALMNAGDSPVAGKIGVAPLPAGEGGISTGTLGGSGLAVSRFSKHPAEAADLIRYLTSPKEQARRATKGAYNPTIPALYHDEPLLQAQPLLRSVLPVLTNAVARPSRIAGTKYNQLSNIFWSAVHDVLAKSASAEAALGEAKRRINRLSRGGAW